MVVKKFNLFSIAYKMLFIGLLFFNIATPIYCDVFAEINFNINGGDPLSNSTVLAGFENASMGESQNQVVWTDEQQNFAFMQAYNYTVSSNIGLTNDAVEGSKALKLNIDFGQDVASANNWGTFVMLMRMQGQNFVPYNLSGYEALSFYAKAVDSTEEIDIAVGMTEYNANPALAENWISSRTTISSTNTIYSFGLNQLAFSLQDGSPVNNSQLDIKQIKTITIFIYKGEKKGLKNVVIDKICLSEDQIKPKVKLISGLPNPILEDSSLTVTVNINETGGLNYSVLPNIALVPAGSNPINFNITTYNNNLLVARGNVPAHVTANSGQFTITGITDIYGNVMDNFSSAVAIGIPDTPAILVTPVLDNISDTSISSNINISGAVSGNATVVSLYVNGSAYATQNVINNKFLFSQVLLTKQANAISVYAKDSLGNNSAPASKNITFTNYNSIDQLDYTNVDGLWKDRGYIDKPLEKIDSAGNKLLKVTQAFDKKVMGDGNWGAIIVKNVPDWRKDFTSFNEITYKMYNDGTHNKVIIRLGLIEKSGETWIEAKDHNLSSVNQAIKVALDEQDLILDVTYNPTINKKLDLADISQVIIYILANGSTGNHTAYIDEIKLSNSSFNDNINPTEDITSDGPPAAPVLKVGTLETSIKNIDVTGNVRGSNVSSVLLYVNNKWVKSANVTSGSFQFKGVGLTATENNFTARAIDNKGRMSILSQSIKVTLIPKEFVQSLIDSREGKPVYITFPVGSLGKDVDPKITEIVLGQKPELAINMPKGRKITDGLLQIIDITLSEKLLQPITIQIPVNKNSADLEPWYYDPIKTKWTQKGLSNWFVTTNIVFDVVENNFVEANYLVFTTSHLSIFGVFEKIDKKAPVVSYIRFDKKTIYEGDFIQNSPKLEVSFADNAKDDAGVSSWNIKAVNANNVAEEVLIKEEQLTEPTASYTVTYDGFKLEDDKDYFVKITLSDAAGNVTVNKTATFKVSKLLKITNYLNGPNPFNPDNTFTEIQYQLSKDADVNIYIFDIAGRKIWETKIRAGFVNGGSSGFNSVAWDGKNLYGETVANGVYIAYIIAHDGAKKKIAKVKIAVLK